MFLHSCAQEIFGFEREFFAGSLIVALVGMESNGIFSPHFSGNKEKLKRGKRNTGSYGRISH